MNWHMMTPFSSRGEFLPGDPFTTLQRQLSRAFDDPLGDRSGPLMGKSMHLEKRRSSAMRRKVRGISLRGRQAALSVNLESQARLRVIK